MRPCAAVCELTDVIVNFCILLLPCSDSALTALYLHFFKPSSYQILISEKFPEINCCLRLLQDSVSAGLKSLIVSLQN